MHSSILVIYQDINSGAKVVTEEVLKKLASGSKSPNLIIHRQSPPPFNSGLTAIKNFVWSFVDCIRVIRRYSSTDKVIYTPYFLAAFVAILAKRNQDAVVFHFHGDHAITKIPQPTTLLGMSKYCYIWFFGRVVATLQKIALLKSNALIFVAQEAYQQIAKKYSLTRQSDRIFLIPNGVSTSSFHPNKPTYTQVKKDLLKKLALMHIDELLLYSGRIDEKKGIHLILEAMSKLKRAKPSIKTGLIIMHPVYTDKDSALYSKQLKTIIKDNKLSVRFITQPPNIVTYYQVADMCVLPSEQEMMPLVMLESLATGTPFFGTNQGNMKRCLKKIHPNLVLENNSAAAIAAAISWLHSQNKSQRIALKNQCIALAKHYPWGKTARSVLQVILQLQ